MIQINVNFFLFTVSKFLITTGKNHDGYQRDSKMLDLSIKGGSNCKDWAELPKDIDSATGGVTPRCCGNAVVPAPPAPPDLLLLHDDDGGDSCSCGH